jgi:hypothetical protein
MRARGLCEKWCGDAYIGEVSDEDVLDELASAIHWGEFTAFSEIFFLRFFGIAIKVFGNAFFNKHRYSNSLRQAQAEDPIQSHAKPHAKPVEA